MDIGKAFTYMFDDEEWVQKLVIGGLLTLVSVIPLVNIFTILVIAGYSLRVLKNVAEGSDRPLPAWDDWGGDWMKGLMVVLAALVYSIPTIIVSGAGWIVTWIAGGGDPSDLSGPLGVCMFGVSCLTGLWSLLVAIVLPAGMIEYATDGQFSSFFRFGAIFRFIGDNLSNYIVAWLLNVVAGIIGSFGFILCVIGLFFTTFWSTIVGSHLFGQVRAEAVAAGVGAGAPYELPAEPDLVDDVVDEDD